MFNKLKSVLSKTKESPAPKTINEVVAARELPRQKQKLTVHNSTAPTYAAHANIQKHPEIANTDLITLKEFLMENNIDISNERCEAWLENQPLEIIMKNILFSIDNNETSTAELEHAILINLAEQCETNNEIAPAGSFDELFTKDDLAQFESSSDFESFNELPKDTFDSLSDTLDITTDIVPTKVELLLSKLNLNFDDIISFYADYPEEYIVAQLEYMLTRTKIKPISSPVSWLQGCIHGDYAKFNESNAAVHEQSKQNFSDLENITSTPDTIEYTEQKIIIPPVTKTNSDANNSTPVIDNHVVEHVTTTFFPPAPNSTHTSLQASVVKTKWQMISALSTPEFTDLLIKSNCYCSSEFCIHHAICYYRREGAVQECDACRSGIYDMLNKPIEFIRNIEV